ncbi:MAG: hypothetical protein MJA29_02910 [Candidatus Omnitrophica bacterium]|nr:hypothetical protein [Candidatus Omnitrophota bacterium]
MTRFRARYDDTQWVLEQFEPGGEKAKRGRTAGQPKAARWNTLGYQPNLKHACRSLLHKLIGDEMPDNAAEITENANAVIDAIERAENRLFDAVQNMPNPSTLDVQ